MRRGVLSSKLDGFSTSSSHGSGTSANLCRPWRRLPDALKYQFVTNIASPYQVDFFRALELVGPGTFHVIFTAPTERDRSFDTPERFGFPADVLPSPRLRLVKDWHRNLQLEHLVEQSSADLVVLGGSYFMPDARAVRNVCKRLGKKLVYWGEHPFKKVRNPPWNICKRAYLSWFLAPLQGVIAVGSKAAVAYASLLRDRPITNIPYAPDLRPLLSPSDQLVRDAAALRRQLGAEGQVVVLFAGSLTPRKAPDLLLEAFSQCSTRVANSQLVFVGDGPLREKLLSRSMRLRARKRVHFLGYLHGDGLRTAYLAADVFALPTRGHEGWGVVLQEAMAAGCAVIASDRVGAAQDLISDGETGLIVPADSEEHLARALALLCENDAGRRAIGEAGQASSATYIGRRRCSAVCVFRAAVHDGTGVRTLAAKGLRRMSRPRTRLPQQGLRATGRVTLAMFVVIGGFVFFVFNDTAWSQLVPWSAQIRVVVPVVMMLFLILERSHRLPHRHLAGTLIVIAAVGLLTAVFSEVPELALIKLALFLGLALPLSASLRLTRNFGVGSAGLWRLAQVSLALLIGNAIMVTESQGGFFNNPNQLGMFVVCTAPALLFVATTETRGRRLVGWLGLLLGGTLCILSYSRASIAGLAVGAIVFLALRRSASVRSVVVLTGVVAALFVFAVMSSENVQTVANKGGSTTIDTPRLLMLKESFEAFKARPVVGYGFGLSQRVSSDDWDSVLSTGRLSLMVGEFGNSSVAVLIAGGTLLFSAFVWSVGTVLMRGVRAIAADRNRIRRQLQTVLVAAMGALLVQAQAEGWFLSVTWPTLVFWLYAGLSDNLSGRVFEERMRRARPRFHGPIGSRHHSSSGLPPLGHRAGAAVRLPSASG